MLDRHVSTSSFYGAYNAGSFCSGFLLGLVCNKNISVPFAYMSSFRLWDLFLGLSLFYSITGVSVMVNFMSFAYSATSALGFSTNAYFIESIISLIVLAAALTPTLFVPSIATDTMRE